MTEQDHSLRRTIQKVRPLALFVLGLIAIVGSGALVFKFSEWGMTPTAPIAGAVVALIGIGILVKAFAEMEAIDE